MVKDIQKVEPLLIIMCKAPVVGYVKTRLMSEFSAEDACRIHSAMAKTVIERARQTFRHIIIAADDPGHAFFSQFGLPLVAQGEGNLGQRMHRQQRAAFAAGTPSVLFIGTDSPHAPEQRWLEAAELLRSHDVVIGPVEDGGYDLIGLRGDWPLFEGVEWSTGRVLQQTLVNCTGLGLLVRELDSSFDIDTPEDLRRAAAMGWDWRA